MVSRWAAHKVHWADCVDQKLLFTTCWSQSSVRVRAAANDTPSWVWSTQLWLFTALHYTYVHTTTHTQCLQCYTYRHFISCIVEFETHLAQLCLKLNIRNKISSCWLASRENLMFSWRPAPRVHIGKPKTNTHCLSRIRNFLCNHLKVCSIYCSMCVVAMNGFRCTTSIILGLSNDLSFNSSPVASHDNQCYTSQTLLFAIYVVSSTAYEFSKFNFLEQHSLSTNLLCSCS